MSMLITIPLLTALIFAALYPLCFWISARNPLKNDFHKFHLGLPNFISGVTVLGLLTMNIPLFIKLAAVLWKGVFFSISHFYWKKGEVNHRMITIPCILGVIVFILVEIQLVILPHSVFLIHDSTLYSIIFSSLLGGLVLCSAFYAMNLGHWYLNVHGLPVSHLERAIYVFWFFVILRAVWNLYILMTGRIYFKGELISMLQFLGHIEGFFLFIALFFGTIFPMIALWFVKGTLDVKSTQSATGILYVILSAVLLGDITYKYYLFRYGLGL